jgi:hypothetical protein
VQSDVYDNLSESVMTKGHCPDLIGFIHKVEQFQSKFAPQPRRLRILVKTTAFAVSLSFLRESVASSDNIKSHVMNGCPLLLNISFGVVV